MSANECKSCGFIYGRLTPARRAALFDELIRVIKSWSEDGPDTTGLAATNVRDHIRLLAADDQGLCVACADKAVLPW